MGFLSTNIYLRNKFDLLYKFYYFSIFILKITVLDGDIIVILPQSIVLRTIRDTRVNHGFQLFSIY